MSVRRVAPFLLRLPPIRAYSHEDIPPPSTAMSFLHASASAVMLMSSIVPPLIMPLDAEACAQCAKHDGSVRY